MNTKLRGARQGHCPSGQKGETMFDRPAKFKDVTVGQSFIEEMGNHNVRYMRVVSFTDDYDNPYNAKIIKPGREHFEFFRDDESVCV